MGFDGYLSFGGIEIVNAERTTAYVENLLPTFPLVRRTHDYDNVHVALGQEPYRTPLLDDADWVEVDGPVGATDTPRNPTHGFLGLYPLSIEGIGDSTMGAEVIEGILDGGFINSQRDATRPIRVRGLLIGLDELAVEAGLTWLRNALRANACGMHGDLCGYQDLRYFLAPPEVCDPLWTQTFPNAETVELGNLDVDTSPLVYQRGEISQPLRAEWLIQPTDGVKISWGALAFDGPAALEEYGSLYLRRSNFVKNPSFSSNTTAWSATSGTVSRVDPGVEPYGRIDQTSPVTRLTNWLPDPSFEHGDPNATGWRSNFDITAPVDGTAPQGTHVALVTAQAEPTWLETTMLGPFDPNTTGVFSFWTRHDDDVTVTVADNAGAVIFTEVITGLSDAWARVSVDGVPVQRNYVVRITVDGTIELRVDGMMLTATPTLQTYFDGDTVLGGSSFAFIGGFAGPSRKTTGSNAAFSGEFAQSDAPFGPVVLSFLMRATESNPSVLVELLDPTDAVIASTTIVPTTGWTRYALGAGFGRQVRARFSSSLGPFDLDEVMLEAGSEVNAYFDASMTAPTDYTLVWTGAPNNSISRMTWTGSTLIERGESFRPFLSVDQGELQGVRLALAWASEVDMDLQLEPYDRTYHRVTVTTGVKRIRDWKVQSGAAAEVDFIITTATPHAFSTQSQDIPFDPEDPVPYADELENLAPYPSVEATSGSVVTRTNLCTNPSGESATTGWAGIPGTTGVVALTNPTVTTSFGVKVVHCQWSTASTAVGGGMQAPDITVTAGLNYSFFVGHVLTSIINRIQLQVEWRTAIATISTVTTAPVVVTAANTAIENSTNFQLLNLVAPATATVARVKIITVAGTSVANWSIASFIEMDGVMAVQGATAPTYFDGATVGASDYTYAWTGTAHLSTSTRSAPTATGYGVSTTATGAQTVGWRTAIQNHSRGHAARTFFVTAPSDDQIWRFGMSTTVSNMAAVSLDGAYHGSVWVRPSKTQRMVLSAGYYTALGVFVSGEVGVETVVASGTWTRLDKALTIPATAAFVRITAASVASGASYSRWVADDYVDVDDLMVTYGTGLYSYFDGASVADAVYEYGWSGTADASTSFRALIDEAAQDPLIDPDLPVVPAPPMPPVVPDVAITTQNEWVRYAITIPKGNVSLWAGTVPTLVLRTLTGDVRQVRVRFHPNPFEWDPEDVDSSTYCGEFLLSYLPANSTLTVSGVTEEAWAEVAGGAPQPANQLLYGTGGTPMVWPELSCGLEYLLTVDIPPTVDFDNLEIDIVVNRRE